MGIFSSIFLVGKQIKVLFDQLVPLLLSHSWPIVPNFYLFFLLFHILRFGLHTIRHVSLLELTYPGNELLSILVDEALLFSSLGSFIADLLSLLIGKILILVNDLAHI